LEAFMTTVSIAVGAVTSNSARVIARVKGTRQRLAVSGRPDLSMARFFDPKSTTSDGYASYSATGLRPNTQYWYAIEDTGTLDRNVTGRFRTHPAVGTPYSHTVATIGDAGLKPTTPGSGSELLPNRISNAPTFDAVRAANPLMTVHLGDLHYYDLGSGDHGVRGGASVNNYRRAYTDIFAQSRQHRLYREIPFQYMWDNHDYGYTAGYADSTHAGRAAAAQVYRERVPHYPTPDASGAIYQSWQIGRVLYVLNDTRFYRSATLSPDSPQRTILGRTQLDWMRNLLRTTTAQALVWLMPTPWLHDDGGIHHWGSHTYERDALVQFLSTTAVPASGGARKWSQSMVQVTADIHALGLCSGRHNPFGGFPVMLCASIDAIPSADLTPTYDLGFRAGRNQWGIVGVDDDGRQITINLIGKVGASPWRSQRLVIPTSAASAQDPTRWRSSMNAGTPR
jgi:alkaline phosphatase D